MRRAPRRRGDTPRTSGIGAFALGVLLAGGALPGLAHGAPEAGVVVTGLPPGTPASTALAKRVHAAVAARPELTARPLSDTQPRFAASGPEDRSADLKAADRLLEKAEEALRGFDVAGATKTLAKASARLGADTGLVHTVALDRRRLALEVALAHARRDERALTRALATYAARFPGAPPEGGLWPPDLRRRLATVAARAQTSLRILSTPDGEVFVDGRAVGRTPTTLKDLPPGRHRVEVRAEGRFPARAWAETEPAKLAEVRLAPASAVSMRLAAVDPRASLPDAVRGELVELGRAANLTLLVLAAPADDDGVTLRLLEVADGRLYGPVAASRPEDALAQVWASRAAARGGGGRLAPWAYGAAGAGVVLAAVGTGLRLWAVDTQDPLTARRGALTQAEAFDIQDRAQQRGTAGTALLVSGAALVAGAAGLLTWDLLVEDAP